MHAQDLRRFVLIALLKDRNNITHPDTLAAINLLDLAFIDDAEVRDAHRNFMKATEPKTYSAEQLSERFHALIVVVVRAIGLSASITTCDIQKGYHPNALRRLDEAALAVAEEKLAEQVKRTHPAGTV